MHELSSQQYIQFRQYLLGTIEDSGRISIEQRILSDEASYEELLIAEDELVDEYLANELNSVDRNRFEALFLITPERRQKLRFGRTFATYVKTHRQIPQHILRRDPDFPHNVWSVVPARLIAIFNRNPVVAYSLIVATAIIIATTFLATSWRNRSFDREQSHSTVTVQVTTGTVRSLGSTQRVHLPASTDFLELQVRLPRNDYATYHGRLTDVDRALIAFEKTLMPTLVSDQTLILIRVPASTLQFGDYRVEVNGITESGASEVVSTGYIRIVQ